MTLISTFTVKCSCCEKFTDTSNEQYEAVINLLNHIKNHHKSFFEKLQIRGRQLAMSQNGCGYFDDGKSKTGGWHESQASFRMAWTRHALEEILNK